MKIRNTVRALVIAAMAMSTALGIVAFQSVASAASKTGAHSVLNVVAIDPPGDPTGQGPFEVGPASAVDAINASGGIDGHKISLRFCNDGSPLSDPNSSAACATSAVADHDLAVLGEFSLYSQNMYPILAKDDIANISVGDVGGTADVTNRLSFLLTPGADVQAAGLGVLLMRHGCTNPALFVTAGVPTNAATQTDFTDGVKYGGGTVGPVLAIPSTQFDFTATIAQLDEAHSDCVAVSVSSTQMEGIYQAIQASGQPMTVAANETVVDSSVISTVGALANGTLLETNDVPLAYQTKDEKLAEAQITKYGSASDVTGYNMLQWETVKVFAAVVNQLIKSKVKLTSQAVFNGLNRLKVNITVGQPINFASKSAPSGEPREFLTGQYFEEVKNLKVVPTSPQLINMLPALAGKSQ